MPRRKNAKRGATLKFTPAELEAGAQDYFNWVDVNPLYEERVFCSKGRIIRTQVAKKRAMSINALRLHLNISLDTWKLYCTKPEYIELIDRINTTIYNQKFEGAAADMFNATIITRDLGLAERREHTGPDGGPIETVKRELTIDELKEEAKKRGLPTSIFLKG